MRNPLYVCRLIDLLVRAGAPQVSLDMSLLMSRGDELVVLRSKVLPYFRELDCYLLDTYHQDVLLVCHEKSGSYFSLVFMPEEQRRDACRNLSMEASGPVSVSPEEAQLVSRGAFEAYFRKCGFGPFDQTARTMVEQKRSRLLDLLDSGVITSVADKEDVLSALVYIATQLEPAESKLSRNLEFRLSCPRSVGAPPAISDFVSAHIESLRACLAEKRQAAEQLVEAAGQQCKQGATPLSALEMAYRAVSLAQSLGHKLYGAVTHYESYAGAEGMLSETSAFTQKQMELLTSFVEQLQQRLLAFQPADTFDFEQFDLILPDEQEDCVTLSKKLDHLEFRQGSEFLTRLTEIESSASHAVDKWLAAQYPASK